jgi:osmotically-inducible protein OsmY
MSDHTLLHDVRNALRDPRIQSQDVTVAVYGGIVLLRGRVHTYREREDAAAIAGGLVGIQGVINLLAVDLAEAEQRPDREIAYDAARALKLNTAVPSGRLMVSVSGGYVTLSGTVNWLFERQAALGTIRNLPGLRGLIDAVFVCPDTKVA